MSTRRFEDGEYMNLIWDGSPDAHYIKGHVSHKDGIYTLIDYGVIDDSTEVGQAVQKYGRWSMQGDAPEGCSSVLREYKDPGRGRFKITEFGVGVFAKQALKESDIDLEKES